MRDRQLKWIRTVSCAFLLALAPAGCDDGDPARPDGSTATDGTGGGDGPAGQDGPLSDGPATDGPVKLDSAVTFAREVTIGYDNGIPAVKLKGAPLARGQLFVEPAAKLLPVEVRKVTFLPATAYPGTLVIAPDNNGIPGPPAATKPFTIKASDVDKWLTIDISDQNAVVTGAFWVTVNYPGTVNPQQEMIYGTTSSSGRNFYFNPGYPLYTTNFDQMIRVVVATPNTDTPAQPGKAGDPCQSGVDCQDGYCLAGSCAASCASAACATGTQCKTYQLGAKVCVKPCAQNSDCPSGAFCLLDETHIKPAKLCVKGGPFVDGQTCKDQYHTICSSGYCSACDTDPSKCNDPGTCKPNP